MEFTPKQENALIEAIATLKAVSHTLDIDSDETIVELERMIGIEEYEYNIEEAEEERFEYERGN